MKKLKDMNKEEVISFLNEKRNISQSIVMLIDQFIEGYKDNIDDFEMSAINSAKELFKMNEEYFKNRSKQIKQGLETHSIMRQIITEIFENNHSENCGNDNCSVHKNQSVH